MLSFRSHAKINLHLDVLGKRRDGYHDIETIFQTISLHDRLDFEAAEAGISLTCSEPQLPVDFHNLVVRAAETLRIKAGARDGAVIHLEKHIPLAAGLAGGSGNAAATLIALNELWSLQWPLERLQKIARELGADVPYCLHGGTMAATERGDVLQPLPPLPDTWFVLVHPPLEVTSASVYHSPQLTYNADKPENGRTTTFEAAIRRLGEEGCRSVFNRMEGPVFFEHPELARLKEHLLELGCTAAAMSGSGPTLFGVCAGESQARDLAARLTDWRTSVARSVGRGAERL